MTRPSSDEGAEGAQIADEAGFADLSAIRREAGVGAARLGRASAALQTPKTEFVSGKVWFIGAGPGDPELITVRGRRLIRQADLVVFAGSLVPEAVIADAGRESASGSCQVADSSGLTLEEIHELCRDKARNGGLVARVHTGDPSLYGALREQAHLLRRDNIDYEVVPGVSAAFAAAAAAKVSLTVPEVSQTVILTRLPGRTPMPEQESLRQLAGHGCSLAVYLSAGHVERLQEELADLPPDTVVICAHQVGWPEEKIVRATTATLVATVKEHALDSHTLFLILPGERQDAPPSASRLYAPDFSHARRVGTES